MQLKRTKAMASRLLSAEKNGLYSKIMMNMKSDVIVRDFGSRVNFSSQQGLAEVVSIFTCHCIPRDCVTFFLFFFYIYILCHFCLMFNIFIDW